MKTCPDCNGDGVVEKGTDDERQCPTCGGSGFVPDDDDGREEIIHTTQPNCARAARVGEADNHPIGLVRDVRFAMQLGTSAKDQ